MQRFKRSVLLGVTLSALSTGLFAAQDHGSEQTTEANKAITAVEASTAKHTTEAHKTKQAAEAHKTKPVTVDPNSPVGQWCTIDDKTHKVKSIVDIWQDKDNGTLKGKVVFIEDPAKQNAVCEKCEGELKNHPVDGLTIITDMKPANEKGKFGDGKILDPESGDTYNSSMTLVDHGQQLDVRGFIGPEWMKLGRTQTWVRTTPDGKCPTPGHS